jgi:hypothetical protein
MAEVPNGQINLLSCRLQDMPVIREWEFVQTRSDNRPELAPHATARRAACSGTSSTRRRALVPYRQDKSLFTMG